VRVRDVGARETSGARAPKGNGGFMILGKAPIPERKGSFWMGIAPGVAPEVRPGNAGKGGHS